MPLGGAMPLGKAIGGKKLGTRAACWKCVKKELT
jgi:hypothetical protein